ncbi:HAD family hydrolase [Luteolibacter yonseiensis]|uniref:HAD family hydrolase n=1 Tax=Luteolibacter yonseiensis TaxID=1144680 RepID=A0A934R458_9BACT|nr:HAD family hydrolase [Luteolibacter yonseiensis]MBK1818073.1 HAD family hydrolase [Luteolibacter yonseiensis]
MLAAIVHYHLDPGGVTTVIRGASDALSAANIPHVILTGGRSDHPRHVRVSGLEYLSEPGCQTASHLTADLLRAATQALGAPPDVWHFHNHSLGKNALLPAVIAQLAAGGERIILQIHDLAEQGRPDNYPVIADRSDLYPVSPCIRYAFLNHRDLAVFTSAGLPPENASLLPNPVAAGGKNPDSDNSGQALLFSPVRGIRRKNLGELVLLAALAPAGTRVAVSRAPANPIALPIHDTWRKFAEKHRLPIGFDVVDRFTPVAGAGSDFASWIAHASHFVTTSVSEGFGLPFLEAIAHGKPLLGRDLPYLSEELAAHGIRHSSVYHRILIPEEWIDRPVLEAHLTTTLERNLRLYRRRMPSGHVSATMKELEQEGWLDFGNLPECLQQALIEKVVKSKSAPECSATCGGDATTLPPHLQVLAAVHRHPDHTAGSPDENTGRGLPLRLVPLTRWLAEVIAIRTPCASPDSLAPWSIENYQTRLTKLYQNLVAEPPSPVRHLSAEKILTAHLTPGSFHFLLSALEPRSRPPRYRAVVFDIYGTLLIAPAGGVKPDLLFDPVLREVLRQHGHEPPVSPSSELHAAVLRHHAAAGVDHPEIDLRVLWREILHLPAGSDTTSLVRALENAWHPASPMPGAEPFIRNLSARGLSLGLLSNAQSNTLADLGSMSLLFSPELTILSYQHHIAKPSPEIFQILAGRLAGRGISPEETLYIGNDPRHDIIPAAAAGFKTALFAGHPESLRDGACSPDITFDDWKELESRYFSRT